MKATPKQVCRFIGALFAASILSVYYLKKQQLALVSPEIIPHYPLSYWFDSILSGALVMTMGGLAICLLLLKCFEWSKKQKQGEYWLVIPSLLFIQVAFNQFLSPLAWDNPLMAVLRHESAYESFASPLYEAYYLSAKRLAFDGFEKGWWGSLPSSMSGGSHVLALMALFFNLPTIDPAIFQRCVLIIFFIACVASSFFFFLLLRRAFKLSFATAYIGACFFLISNPSAANAENQSFPLFFLPFLMLPITLWLMHLAFSRNNLVYAPLAGLVSALGYYTIQSHPDSVWHAHVFWVSVSFYLGWVSGVRFAKILGFILLGTITYLLGSLHFLLPIIESVMNKELRIFGHQEPFHFVYGLGFGLQSMTWAQVRNLGLFFPYAAIGGWVLWKNRGRWEDTTKKTLCFWIALYSAFVFLFVAGEQGPLSWVLHTFHLKGIVFRETNRIFLYYDLILYVLILFSLDQYFGERPIRLNLDRGLNAFIIIISYVLFYRRYSILSYLVPLAIPTAILLFFTLKYKGVGIWRSAALASALSFLLAHESNMNWTSAKLFENEANCKPYQSLRASLVKAKWAPEDSKASIKYIKRILNTYAKATAKNIVDRDEEVFQAADKFADEIDQYHLSHNCIPKIFAHPEINPIEKMGPAHNSIALFENLSSPYSRILLSSPANIGVLDNLFALNAHLNPDLMFMMPYPNLVSLYGVPSTYMEGLGLHYTKEEFSKPLENPIRKLFNIAGIDVLVLDRELNRTIKDISGVVAINNRMLPLFDPKVLVVNDTQSYGFSYLAQRIHYVSKASADLTSLLPPFKASEAERKKAYGDKVKELQDRLVATKSPREIFIEDDTKARDEEINKYGSKASRADSVEVINAQGARAAFHTYCEKDPCHWVFNTAALKGWKVYVESQELARQRANFAFLSALIPSGSHLVWAEYRPLGEFLGRWISILSFVGGYFFYLRYRLKNAA